MSDFQVVEVPLTTWKVTSMCRKLLFQVVHETNFLRLNERPKKCPKSKLQCLMRCCNHLPNQYKLNPLHPLCWSIDTNTIAQTFVCISISNNKSYEFL